MEKTIEQMVQSYPDGIKQEIQDRIMVFYGLKQLKNVPALQQKCFKKSKQGIPKGQRWNNIVNWYDKWQDPRVTQPR